MPDTVTFKRPSNVDFLNGLREKMSTTYQERIPEVTKGNIEDTINEIWNYEPIRNEFISSLINKVGLTYGLSMQWQNPLAPFKVGMLGFGDTIEEYYVNLIEGLPYSHDRDYLEKDLFGQNTPRVFTNYHRINREQMYKITIKQEMLKRAFNSSHGLSDLVTRILDSIVKSDTLDEFLSMANLFRENYDRNGFFKKQVGNVAGKDSSAPESKQLLRAIREMASTITFPETHYNAAGVQNPSKPEDMVIITTPGVKAALEVEALSAAFNLDKADVQQRIIPLLPHHINIPGAQAILTTKDFFVVADTLYESRVQPNPAGLYDNHFLHHHQIISMSTFVNSVLFTTEEDTPIVLSIDTKPTSIEAEVFTFTDGKEKKLTSDSGASGTAGFPVYELPRGTYARVKGKIQPDTATTGFSMEWDAQSKFSVLRHDAINIAHDESRELITVVVRSSDPKVTTKFGLKPTGDRIPLWPEPEA